jgi:hypothetical protein
MTAACCSMPSCETDPPDADPDNVPAYLGALREGRARLATAGGQRYDPDQLAASLFRRPPGRAALNRQEATT